MRNVVKPTFEPGSATEPRRLSSILARFLPALAILISGLACGGTTPTTSPGIEQTQNALAAQATSLANQALQLTQQAAQQPPPPVATQPPPPAATQPPPPAATQPPPPAATQPPPVPTETESPYAEGSMVRAPYDPAANWGSPDVHEDFEGTSGLFAERSGSTYASWYGEGLFNITFTSRGWWTWFFGDVGLPPSFYVDVVVINGDQCVDRDSAGMLLRGEQTGDFGFLFGVTCKGGYYIGVSAGPGATGPVCMFKGSAWNGLMTDLDCSGLPMHNMNDYIEPGPGAVNRIGVRGNGTHYEMYVNGHHVGSLQDNWTPVVLPPNGWIGGYPALFLGAGQRDNSAVRFDDFSLWRNP